MILLILFSFLTGLSKAISDTLAYHYDISIFGKWDFNRQYWDTALSWKNKYKDASKDLKERFFLSKTLLVFLTDAWHLFNMLGALSIALIIEVMPYVDKLYILGYYIPNSLLFIVIRVCTFHLFFTYFLVKKIPFQDFLTFIFEVLTLKFFINIIKNK